jgi:hypothetical protein
VADIPDKRLHPIKLLLESLLFVWWFRVKFISCLAVPTLILVIIWGVRTVLFKNETPLIGWTFWFLYQIGFVLFAITCHRLVLLRETKFVFYTALKKRALVFLFWLLAASILSYFLSTLTLTIMFNFPVFSQLLDTGGSVYVAYFLATLPALYFVSRVSLIFPATAVDFKSSFRQSWKQTTGHGWKMVVIVGLYPWLISILLWLIVRGDPSLIKQMITAFLYYIGLALEVTALSLTFKAFSTDSESTA